MKLLRYFPLFGPRARRSRRPLAQKIPPVGSLRAGQKVHIKGSNGSPKRIRTAVSGMRVRRPRPLDYGAVFVGNWLGDQDSNLGEVIQSHLCYRYIIPQRPLIIAAFLECARLTGHCANREGCPRRLYGMALTRSRCEARKPRPATLPPSPSGVAPKPFVEKGAAGWHPGRARAPARRSSAIRFFLFTGLR